MVGGTPLSPDWLVLVLLMMVPVIGLVQVSDAAMADRFAYLPLIGLFVVVAWGLPDALTHIPIPRQVLVAVAAGAIVALAVDARVQLAYWRDSLTLWQRSFAVAPAYNFRARVGMADALSAAGRSDEAIREYREALRMLPASASTHNDLGVVLARENQLEAARAEFMAAIQLHHPYDNVAQMHNNLGAVLARLGNWPEAIARYSEALRIDPQLHRPVTTSDWRWPNRATCRAASTSASRHSAATRIMRTGTRAWPGSSSGAAGMTKRSRI